MGKNQKSNKIVRLFQVSFIVFLCGVAYTLVTPRIDNMISIHVEQQNLDKQLTSYKKTLTDLEREYELVGTDEMLEKVARERLGLVKRDEIVYIIEE